MKCPQYNTTMANNMEKRAAAQDYKGFHAKRYPVNQEPTPIKPHGPPGGEVPALFSLNNNTRPIHNKENSRDQHDGAEGEEGFDDSGYLSLHNSQIVDHHGDEEDDHARLCSAAESHQGQTISPKASPSKCQRRNSGCAASLALTSPPVAYHQRRTAAHLCAPSSHHHSNLTILNFEQAVCEELAKSYQKSKRYDWSIVTKVAENHLLDRVIGGQMGQEYVDVFSSLLSRNMRIILTNILALLGDMDLISCKKVSSAWRRIICEDAAAVNRCQRAEQALRESSSSLKHQGCGLTRDVAVSRVVLSCMQTLASSGTPSSSSSSSAPSSSSSTPSCRLSRRSTPSLKSSSSSTPDSQCTRFREYMQAASGLKQHESLRSCKRCGSPATHLAEVQRATCTRPSCLFDFCTHCQGAFHGSTPCRVVQPRSLAASSRSTPLIPGSARSKRSIRRL